MEEIVCLRNSRGDLLHGVLHYPQAGFGHSAAVIMLNSGTNNRVGWHRFNVKIARYLSENGFHVLRYDAHGIGYSEGRLLDTEDLHVIHDEIETGLLSDDVHCAVDYIMNTTRSQKVFLSGQCGGALTGIIAAGRDKRISGITYLAGPVVMATSEKTIDMHPRDAQLQAKGYLRKLCKPDAWIRLMTFKSDYRDIYRIFKIRLQERFFKSSLIADVSDDYEVRKEARGGLVINKSFLKAFKTMMKDGRRILFIMPSLDRASWSFKEMFQEHYLRPGNPYEPYYTIVEIEGSNHAFSRDENQTQVINLLGEWFLQMADA